MSDPAVDRLLHDRVRLVQAVAEICGEFSLSAAGTVFRVVEPDRSLVVVLHEGLEQMMADGLPPRILEIEPERAEGIYESIAAKLHERPEYQPLAEARREAEKVTGFWASESRRADKLRRALEKLVIIPHRDGAHCTLCDQTATTGWRDAVAIVHGRDCPLWKEPA